MTFHDVYAQFEIIYDLCIGYLCKPYVTYTLLYDVYNVYIDVHGAYIRN